MVNTVNIIFDNYKNRIANRTKKSTESRLSNVMKFYDQYDEDNKGYLTIRQARKFFATILDLDYKHKSHRNTFVKILKIIDPEEQKLVLKERIVDFFEIRGFLNIKQLEEEHKNMQKSSDSDEEEIFSDTDNSCCSCSIKDESHQSNPNSQKGSSK